MVQARDRAEVAAFTLKAIATTTGLPLAACSRIRAASKVPHPKHWIALRDLAEAQKR
ncbi:MAG: hypothetical protein WCC84_09830 [Candidatus Cybelea sp.]